MSRHHALGIPDAWPALMTREQACAYLGVGLATFSKICPVCPLDLGANVLRWPKAGLDAWIAKVPPRLISSQKAAQDAPPTAPEPAGDDLEWAEARRRAQKQAEKRHGGKNPLHSAR